MQILKDIFRATLVGTLIFCFVLLPIPKMNTLHAEDSTDQTDCTEDTAGSSSGVYKPGCNLDDALTQSKMENVQGAEEDKWKGYFEQAVLAMMSVVFLDNLFLKYLYAKDPTVYGNDCAENTAANYTIRGAQLASLAYIIGEVQANIKYKESAKEAVDLEFSAKSKNYIPSEDSPEVEAYKEAIAKGENAGEDPRIKALKDNNAQEEAYNTLIKILEAQAQAIKTKITLATTAEIALLAVEAAELLNIQQCKQKCTDSYNKVVNDFNKLKSDNDQSTQQLDNLENQYKFSLSKMTYPQSCKELNSNVKDDKQNIVEFDKNGESTGKENGTNVDQKDTKKNKKFFGILAGLAALFQMNKIEDSDSSNTQIYTGTQQEDEQDEKSERNNYNNKSKEEGQNTSQRFQTISQNIIDCEKALSETNIDKVDSEIDQKQGEFDAKDAEITSLDGQMQANQTEQTEACSNPYTATLCTSLQTQYKSLKAQKEQAELKKDELESDKQKLESDKNQAEDYANDTWKSVKTSLSDTYAQQFIYLHQRTQCCGFAGISTDEAQNVMQVIANLKSNAKTAELGEKTSDALDKINSDMQDFVSTYSPGQKVDKDAVSGSFIHQGFTSDSEMSKRKDITQFNPLKKNKTSFFDSAPKGDYSLEVVLPIILENHLYNYVYTNNVNWETNNPILISEQIADVTAKIDRISVEVKKLIQSDLLPKAPVIIADEIRIANFVSKLSNIITQILPIQNAHAIDASGAGMAIGGMALNMLANELGGPWAEVLNVGSKYLMLKGILGMLGVTELFLKPKSRSLTWAALIVLTGAVIAFDSSALKKVEENIEILKAERDRYLQSAATRTSLNTGNTRNNGATLKLKKYDLTKSKTSKMDVKACVVPKGDGFAPAACPSIIPKERVSLPEIQSRLKNHLSPDHMAGISLMSDTIYGASNGSNLGAENMKESTFETFNNTKNALRNLVGKLRDQFDKDEERKSKQRGVQTTSLAKAHASFKKVYGQGGSNTIGSNYFASLPISTTSKASSKIDFKKDVKKGNNISGSSVVSDRPKTSSLDLDFGDDAKMEASVNTNDKNESKQHSQNLVDYEVGMNDINTRKEISIWKILSNRYIISYPKLLEEEKK